MPVPEKIRKMLDAGHETFYRTVEGKKYFYDFASGDYKPMAVSGNIITLAALKAWGKPSIPANPPPSSIWETASSAASSIPK